MQRDDQIVKIQNKAKKCEFERMQLQEDVDEKRSVLIKLERVLLEVMCKPFFYYRNNIVIIAKKIMVCEWLGRRKVPTEL